MSELQAAGWYPDPHDDSSQRWWGGTDWTANTRPLNQAPGQAPQPPLPAVIVPPPAGWYPDPQNAAGEKWFDGADWTQVTRQRATQPTAGTPEVPGLLGSLSGQIQQGVRDPQGFYRRHHQGVDAAAGGALLVDGLVGLPTPKGKRIGVFASLGGIAFGLLFIGMSFIVPTTYLSPPGMGANASGTVTRLQISQSSASSASQPNPPTCMPVAEFVVDGKTYPTAGSAVSPCPWHVGQQVDVAYDPLSPTTNKIPNHDKWLDYLPWGFAGFGALMILRNLFTFVRSVAEIGAGGSLLVRTWRRRKA